MKILLAFGMFFFSLSFCNLTDKFLNRQSANAPAQNSNTRSNTQSNTSGGDLAAEKPELTAEQSATIANGKDVKWDEQGIEWKLPATWKKISVAPTMLNWGSPDNAFLIATISPMSADFPVDISTKAYYDGAVTRKKNGELEDCRYMEIDGIKGVEFTETMPHQKDDPRRFQWIAYRKYAGQVQQVNIMLSTKGSNFDKHRDEFKAVMYSMKLIK